MLDILNLLQKHLEKQDKVIEALAQNQTQISLLGERMKVLEKEIRQLKTGDELRGSSEMHYDI